MNPYIYTYQNPIKYINPNGKQVDITVNDNTITLKQHLVFYGKQASPDLSTKIATNSVRHSKNQNLSYSMGNNTYNVKLITSFETVTEEQAITMAANNKDNAVQFIAVGDAKRSSFHNIGENSGWYSTNDDLANSTTASHEGAHGMGLKHRDGTNGDETNPPNIIRPKGGNKVAAKWSIGNDNNKGMNPYKRVWTNGLAKKVLDKASWNKDKTSGSVGKATNRIYQANGNEKKNKMIIKKIILISFLSIFFCCTKHKENSNKDYKCIEWINDKNGCDGIRKLEYAESIIKKRNILNGPYSDFVRIFGKPNIIEEDLNHKMLFYYTDSSCNNGEIIKGSEVCFIIFYFENNKFKELSMRCE